MKKRYFLIIGILIVLILIIYVFRPNDTKSVSPECISSTYNIDNSDFWNTAFVKYDDIQWYFDMFSSHPDFKEYNNVQLGEGYVCFNKMDELIDFYSTYFYPILLQTGEFTRPELINQSIFIDNSNYFSIIIPPDTYLYSLSHVDILNFLYCNFFNLSKIPTEHQYNNGKFMLGKSKINPDLESFNSLIDLLVSGGVIPGVRRSGWGFCLLEEKTIIYEDDTYIIRVDNSVGIINDDQMYLVNDTLHWKIWELNETITYQLSKTNGSFYIDANTTYHHYRWQELKRR